MVCLIALSLMLSGCGSSNTASCTGACARSEAGNAAAPGAPSTPVRAAVTPPAAAPSVTMQQAAGTAVTISLPSGIQVNLIEGSRPARGVQRVCTVTIGNTTIDTLGAGDLEAYECRPLVEAGALPAESGNARIGLLYHTGSANAKFNTALILVQHGAVWALDGDSLGKYDDNPAATSLKALRNAMKAH